MFLALSGTAHAAVMARPRAWRCSEPCAPPRGDDVAVVDDDAVVDDAWSLLRREDRLDPRRRCTCVGCDPSSHTVVRKCNPTSSTLIDSDSERFSSRTESMLRPPTDADIDTTRSGWTTVTTVRACHSACGLSTMARVGDPPPGDDIASSAGEVPALPSPPPLDALTSTVSCDADAVTSRARSVPRSPGGTETTISRRYATQRVPSGLPYGAEILSSRLWNVLFVGVCVWVCV
jgi:hypothetical protein